MTSKKPSHQFCNFNQLKILENEYQRNNFILKERRIELAEELGLSEKQILFWYKHRRKKEKKLMSPSRAPPKLQDSSTDEDDPTIDTPNKGNGKKKSRRQAYTFEQVKILNEEFQVNRFVDQVRRYELADILNLTEQQVLFWFKNKRKRYKESTVFCDSEDDDDFYSDDSTQSVSTKKLMKSKKENSATVTHSRHKQNEDSKTAGVSKAKIKLKKNSIFTHEQLEKLEKQFSKNHYVTDTQKIKLAEALKVSQKHILYWFKERRRKEKKKILDDDENIYPFDTVEVLIDSNEDYYSDDSTQSVSPKRSTKSKKKKENATETTCYGNKNSEDSNDVGGPSQRSVTTRAFARLNKLKN